MMSNSVSHLSSPTEKLLVHQPFEPVRWSFPGASVLRPFPITVRRPCFPALWLLSPLLLLPLLYHYLLLHHHLRHASIMLAPTPHCIRNAPAQAAHPSEPCSQLPPPEFWRGTYSLLSPALHRQDLSAGTTQGPSTQQAGARWTLTKGACRSCHTGKGCCAWDMGEALGDLLSVLLGARLLLSYVSPGVNPTPLPLGVTLLAPKPKRLRRITLDNSRV